MEKKFAKVIVDIASSLVDKVFDYYFCDENYQKGMRVLVPFGNRVIEGYIIDISDTCVYEENKIKRIIRAIDTFPCIHDDQFKLASFMKEKYNIGMCDCIRLFIPAEMRQGKVKDLEITYLYLADEDKAKLYLSTLRKTAHAQTDAILFMLEKGSAPQADLNKLFGSSAINKLKENEILLSRTEVIKRTPFKDVKSIQQTHSIG